MLPSRTRIVYLAVVFLSVVSLALLVAATGPTLPYGAFARPAFVAILGLAALPAVGLAIAWARERTLVSGELLRMDPLDIPRRPDHLWLGFAFSWKTHHAEKLYHCLSRGIEVPEKVQTIFGGNTLLHALGGDGEGPLFVSHKKRTHHMLVLGAPGEGKTRFLELQIRQLIEEGESLVIIDPKGDERLINLVRQVCEETGRGGQFRMVAPPWPSVSCAYNPLTNFSAPGDIADRLIGALPPAGGDSAPFRGFQSRAVLAVVQAMYLCGMPITLARVLHYLQNLMEIAQALVDRLFPRTATPQLHEAGAQEVLNRYVAAAADGRVSRSPELDLVNEHLRYKPEYYSKMIATLLPDLERLSVGVKRELLSPEPQKTDRVILEWAAVDHQKLVSYFYLGSMHGPETAASLGKMILLDFQSYIARRYSYPGSAGTGRITLIVDEAHHLVSEPFFAILAEGRGANIAIVLSTQTTAQFEHALKSRAAVDEILGQHFAYFQFQTRSPREAADFEAIAGERQMKVVGESYRYEPGFFNSGLHTVEDFRAMHSISFQYKDAALIPGFAIAMLPTFHFFARVGGQFYKGRIPLLTDPVSTYAQDIPKRVAA